MANRSRNPCLSPSVAYTRCGNSKSISQRTLRYCGDYNGLLNLGILTALHRSVHQGVVLLVHSSNSRREQNGFCSEAGLFVRAKGKEEFEYLRPRAYRRDSSRSPARKHPTKTATFSGECQWKATISHAKGEQIDF